MTDDLLLEVVLPVRLVSEANAHEHWRERQKRAKYQRQVAGLLCRLPGGWMPIQPGRARRVLMTRVAANQLDSDNAVGAAKHVRDGIADAMGIDDRSPLIDWQVAQEKGRRGHYAVRVQICEFDR